MHNTALDRLEVAATVALARDLELVGAEAVYLIGADQVGLHAHYAGMAGPSFAYRLKDYLRGGWRGEGPGVVIRVDDNPAVTAATVAHELGHLIDWRQIRPVCPTDPVEATATTLQALSEFQGPVDLEDVHHGAAFCRASLHTAYRLVTLADHDCGIGALWPKVQCPVAPWDAFRALEAEMQDRVAEPIGLILETPAPVEFSKLFPVRKSV